MSGKKDGFEDWEDDFFSQGDTGDANWADDGEAEKAEAERKAAEEAAQLEAEKAEAERKAAEEAAQLEAEKAEAERQAAEEAARLEAEKAEAERAEAERAEAERVEAEKAEAERIAAEEAAKAEEEQQAADAAAQVEAAHEAAEAAEAEEAERNATAEAEASAAAFAADQDAIRAALAAEMRRREVETDAGQADAHAAISSGPTIVADFDDEPAEAPVASHVAAVQVPVETVSDDESGDDDSSAVIATAESFDDPPSDVAPTESVPRTLPGEGADIEAPPMAAELASEAPAEVQQPISAGPRYAPSAEEAGAWQELVTMLQTEASGRTGSDAASLLADAARVARTRVNDLEQAESLARSAVDADGEHPAALTELTEVLNRTHAFEELESVMRRLGKAIDGDVEGAETLHDAAVLARRHLGNDGAALELLEQSIARNPEDYFSLQRLRDLHVVQQDWAGLCKTLAAMAELSEGTAKARTLHQRGRILSEQLGNDIEGAAALRASREADPTHAPSFLALERLYMRTQNWEDLAGLYAGAAETANDADAAFFLARAARIQRVRVKDADAAAALYQDALEKGAGSELQHEYQAFLNEAGRWAELVVALEHELQSTDEYTLPFVQYRIGRIQELHIGDLDSALSAYREVAKDPSAAPAAEAVGRILSARGKHKDLVAFWKERFDLVDDPNLKVTLAYRMGELCEGPLDDAKGAREHYEAILEIAPGYLPALEGLERVYTKLEVWDQLAAVYEQRAIMCEEPGAIALQLHRAGAVHEFRRADAARAREFYVRALEHQADFPPSLDATTRILEAEKAWPQLAATLRAAANASQDGSEQVSLYYRAARILADHVDDTSAAIECLQACLDLSPGFLGAHYLLKELKARTQDLRGLFDLQYAESQAESDLDRKNWQALAAAGLGDGLEDVDGRGIALEVLSREPAHPGALVRLEQEHLRTGDLPALIELYRRAVAEADTDEQRARISATVADMCRDSGQPLEAIQAVGEVLDAEDASTRPLLGLARLCEGLNFWEQAHRALAAAGQDYDAARLQEDYLEAPDEAMQGYSSILEAQPEHLAAALAMTRLHRRSGDRSALAQAHARVAGLVEHPALRVVHHILAGHLFEGLDDLEKSAEAYKAAFDARPCRGKAFDGVRRGLLAAKDVDGLVALYGALPAPHPSGLAADLEEVEEPSRAADVLADMDGLGAALRRARVLEMAERWKDAFAALSDIAESAQSDALKQDLLAKQRWMLAEKLAETDEAWDFYRKLHEQAPEDTEVLEALARIAGARGEVDLGISYLSQLAERLTGAEDAARVQRRIAEIHEANDNPDAAREAYLAALTHQPEDRDALSGLRRVAEASEDWKAMVGVLAREASIFEGADQVERYVEIARIWQDKLEDAGVAADAWRKVLELAPDDQEALGRLVGLSEAAQDWASFVQHAEGLTQHLEGAERSALLGRIGVTHSQHLRKEDEALRFLEQASAGEHPDLEAARSLEQLRSSRGEWELVVEALRRQARALEPAQGAEVLLRAARIRLNTLQSREGAAELFEDAIRIQPDNNEALRFLATWRYERDDREGAVELFEQLEKGAEEWDLDDFDERVEVAEFYYQYGTTLIALARRDDAKAKLKEALTLNQSHLPTLRAIGPLYMEDQDHENAQTVYRQILQLIGGSAARDEQAEAYVALGQVELALGKSDKARKRFNKALELSPNDIRALQGVASVLHADGEWSNLLNVYNTVIYHAKEPRDVIEAYLTKGYVLDAQMGLVDKAAQHYQKTLAFDPGQAEALLRLGELALRKQDWAEAASLADRALALENPWRRGHLLVLKAAASQSVGDTEGASADYASGREADDALADALGELDIADVAGVHGALKQLLQASR